MKQDIIQFAPKGMFRDLSESKFSPEFTYNNLNIRIAPYKHATGLSVTNEQGTKLIEFDSELKVISGQCVGSVCLNNSIILFTTGVTDIIYKIKVDSPTSVIKLFEGELDLAVDYPIQAISIFETENVQKVYWTDGKNPVRMVNICKSYLDPKYSKEDFSLVIPIPESTSLFISRSPGGGKFPSGVLQYAVTFFNIFGSETHIAANSQIQYLGKEDRALSPEEYYTDTFSITVNTNGHKYDYVRLYSIVRTSENATPYTKVVGDYPIAGQNSITILDNGTLGYTIEPQLLLFIGGDELIASTIANKDNTLFLGNIKNPLKLLVKSDLPQVFHNNFTWSYRPHKIIEEESKAKNIQYPYLPLSNKEDKSSNCHFKKGQIYRFGFVAQHSNGTWSAPIYLGDTICSIGYQTEADLVNKRVLLSLNKANYSLPTEIVNSLLSKGYKKVKPVFVLPNPEDRAVLCQGIINSTLTNSKMRDKNAPFAFTDYLARTNEIDRDYTQANPHRLYPLDNYPGSFATGHFFSTAYEIETAKVTVDFFPSTYKSSTILNNLITPELYNYFLVDENLLTLWSPDIEFNDNFNNLLDSTVTCELIGLANVTSTGVTDSYINSIPAESRIISKFAKNNYDKYLASETPGINDERDFYNKAVASNYTTLKDPSKNYEDSIWGRQKFTISGGTGDNDADIKNVTLNKFSSKVYCLYNTIFNETNLTNLKINTPIISSFNKGISIHPYTTNKEDFNGTINFNTIVQEDILDGGPSDNMNSFYPTPIRYKTNSHAIFSLKNKSRDGATYSNVLPGLKRSNDPLLMTVLTPTWHITKAEDGVTITIKAYIKLANISALEEGLILTFPFKLVYSYYTDDYYNETEPVIYEETLIINSSDQLHKHSDDFGLGVEFNYTTILPNHNNTIIESKSGIFTFNSNIPELQDDYILRDQLSAAYYCTYPKPFYRTEEIGFIKEYLQLGQLCSTTEFNKYIPHPFFYLAELRKNINPDVIYGGKTDRALLQNPWISCGIPELLVQNNTCNLEFIEGDTYVSRYDCLRVIPEDDNFFQQVVTMVSFLCESYINLDGRYDRNRYFSDILHLRPSNTNLLNKVYSQPDNFFTYRMLDEKQFESTSFPNMVIWSGMKNPNELVDSWTNLNQVSSIFLDGTLGEVTSLLSYNSELFAFQKKGLSHLLFNSRVQIPTSDNTPIEITNSYKMSGSRYISTTSGADSHLATIVTSTGVYYIDSGSKSIFKVGAEGLLNVTELRGFKTWANQNITNTKHTVGESFNNYIIDYDNIKNELYFTDKNSSLCFTENLVGEKFGYFTSFFSYQNARLLNLNGELYGIKSQTGTTTIHKMNAGKGNHFFGSYYPSEIHFIANKNPGVDKVFNVSELSVDFFTQSGVYQPSKHLTTIQLWHEHQNTGEVPLVVNKNLQKRFKTWKAILPRQQSSLNRIINPWVNLKLKYIPEDNSDDRIVIHSISLEYTF